MRADQTSAAPASPMTLGALHHAEPKPTGHTAPTPNCTATQSAVAGPLHILRVRAWHDPAVGSRGHDPRSAYVERFWIAVLGPSVVWLLRLLAREFDEISAGEEIHLDLDSTARRLGLQHRGGRQSTFMRTIDRCRMFDLAHFDENAVLMVRRLMPAVPRRLRMRMPQQLRDEIGDWRQADDRSDFSVGETRLLATCMLTLGHGLHESAERLVTLGLAPSAANEATAWAWAERCMRTRTRSSA
ncbi:hypothetical protein [Candidatus Poriferisodalis sp.]|uniref:hypothetical protein n=1 Tax=Candidatus Poriferisodalis sp. TaxID=3101277 RepID=UPI003B019916